MTRKKDGRAYYYPRLSASQVNKEPLLKMRRIFGGSITRWKRKRENWQDLYSWQAVGGTALGAIDALRPYLSEKRTGQIDEVLRRVEESRSASA